MLPVVLVPKLGIRPAFNVPVRLRFLSRIAVFVLMWSSLESFGQELPALGITRSNNVNVLRWSPYPGTEAYRILTSPDFSIRTGANGTLDGFDFTTTNEVPSAFYWLEVTPVEDRRVLAATVLNRLAYGPTPDELDRILLASNAIGADVYIAEQLRPELIVDSMDVDTDPNQTNWYYVTASGTATGPTIYLYTSRAGSLYIDDLKLVAGSVPEAGTNLLVNGDFELPLTTPWAATTDFTNSIITMAAARSGVSSLQLIGTAGGSGSGDALSQRFATSVNTNTVYTISFWYRPVSNATEGTFTVRLSGSRTVARQPLGFPPSSGRLYSMLTNGTANLSDLRAWFLQHAISSKRQLLEVLTQFVENHFVTQHAKSVNYFDAYYNDFAQMDRLAANLEFREITGWRQALSNPDCTFHDLLKISAESAAMIIYLDTVNSRGDGTFIANENYARELFELFCNGVDNGYDQNDIVQMSRVWTGWSVDILDGTNIYNPHANRTTVLIPGAPNNARSNLFGVWTFKYRPERHYNGAKTIFGGKTVPARFGSPWTGRSYELRIPARSGTNSIQDGYDALAHLANLPFTQEYISVKLCRLFVHDDFEHGYDFTQPDLSPEAQLVKQCMLAWEAEGGKLRPVLEVIFNSELFRSRNAWQQKIKTPLEFTVSTIRALRTDLGRGVFSAATDGYSISGRSRTAGSAPLTRMGGMMLFDRSDPDGYPESGDGWISAGVLAERLRFVQTTLMAVPDRSKSDAIAGGNFNTTDPVGLLKLRLPSSSWNNAGAIADLFLQLIYPAEGAANLTLYRKLAIDYLNSADNGIASNFNSLSVGTIPYDTRVRGMVALLLTLPRFQEQ